MALNMKENIGVEIVDKNRIAEFETIEGFDKTTGAHLVTHEELVDEDAEPEIKDEMMLAYRITSKKVFWRR